MSFFLIKDSQQSIHYTRPIPSPTQVPLIYFTFDLTEPLQTFATNIFIVQISDIMEESIFSWISKDIQFFLFKK